MPTPNEQETVVKPTGVISQVALDAIPAAVAVLDADGFVVAANVAWIELNDRGPVPACPVGVDLACAAVGSPLGEPLRDVIAGRQPRFQTTITSPAVGPGGGYHVTIEGVSESPGVRAVVTYSPIAADRAVVQQDADALHRYESLVQALGEIVYERTLSGDTLRWRGAVERVLGCTAEELGYELDVWLQRVHPDDRGRLAARLQDAARRSEPFETEYRMQHADGSYRWICDRGTPTGTTATSNPMLIGVMQDVTERRNIEVQLQQSRQQLETQVQQRTSALERSNAELEEFAYITSHDLQEPLRMVTSFCQLLQRRYQGRLDKDADEFIAFAVDGAERMQRLIQDLLTLSRVGRRGRAYHAVELGSVCQQAIANLATFIAENDAEVTCADLPTVWGDPTQLTLLFQNLIQNGVKFRRSAPPRVRIAARADGEDWIVAVTDNGIGFDPQHADRIFHVFQRLHTRAEYPGTGIGLAICKKVVERHGGQIAVESTPGSGSTFLIRLPSDGRMSA